MGSTRLPGKVTENVRGRPLVLWTVAAVAAVPDLDELVVATTDRPEDDGFAELLRSRGIRVHRGSASDVLARIVDAVGPFAPDLVLRQTGDNPFPDPDVMAAQLTPVADGTFDYVGIAGLPLGIGAEAVRAEALFAIGSLADPPAWRHPRYTVDTPDDLAFARALAAHLGPGDQPARLAELE